MKFLLPLFSKLPHVVGHTVFISLFVFAMMILVDFFNILYEGKFVKYFSQKKNLQYLLASLLGIMPGCLGSFISVTLFEHGVISFGAIIATMIATMGDEAFVMFALAPKKAIVLTAWLFIIGLVSGFIIDIIDILVGKKFHSSTLLCENFAYHEKEEQVLQFKNIFNLKKMSDLKIMLLFPLIAFFLLLFFNIIKIEKLWIKGLSLFISLISIIIVLFSSEHFVKDHIYRHIVKKHLPNIFFWTFLALFFISFLQILSHNFGESIVLKFLSKNYSAVLLFAVLLGILPESGPHLFLVMLYIKGQIPFSILIANSIVQDGHGMLPVLAFSRKQFVIIKFLNIVIGLICGILFHFVEA